MEVIGEIVHFEFSTADATTAAVITIYSNDAVARPIQAGERLVITDIHVSGQANMVVDVFNGVGASPGAGERLFNIVASTTVGTSYPSLTTPAYCSKNITPKVKASAAGNLVVIGTGVLVKV
jgi:hypothetical protein